MAAEAGKAPARLTPAALAMHGALLLLLAWWYGGDLLRYVRATTAEVAMIAQPPSLALSVVGLLVLAGGAALLGLGLARKRDASWRGYRLGPIAGVALLFFDFAVLSSVRSPMTAQDRVVLAVVALADGASQHASHEAVPVEPRLLESLVADVGPVPLFSRGVRLTRWTVDVRRGCAGPAGDAAGKGPGTLIYCVAADFKRAWVTAVGVAEGAEFGPPAVVSVEPPWMQEVSVAEATAVPSEDPPVPELGAPGDVWQAPTPEEGPDSGR
ncbi:MAG: hypothetical protein AB1938_05900 [Myxococcota bacterium]